ncbi:MAG TPA: Gfo/Idh/MocA family oxidoreductase [Pseudonocardia sp.]|uniref:Gfo/Idh/MocA family protein n=1 Tax=Pseudonocardia sp. TaxID=60912 RepID=UPI002B4B7292|nr:Gfo/Idh/MocA family oxidoreductase [Pseudonocardia sp.]HLU59817.1 Gfo/Idh/MocA family oxidoreductase [Pseudonocardia sp.]
MRIGVMSLAHLHAVGYVGLLSGFADVELAVADPDAAQRPPGESGGRAFAERLGVTRYFDSYADLLDWGPDGVVICSENSRHRELTELAAAAGAHVLCEKPMATTVADGEAMLAACAAAGVHLMIAYPVRFSRQFRALQAALPALGRLVAAAGTNNGVLPTARAWFADPVLAGGGAVMDHTVHLADLLDVVLDGAEPESVHAVANKMINATARVETGGQISLRYPGGVIATIDCSWSVPEHYPTWGGLTMRLVGEDGIADMDAFAQAVLGFRESTRSPLRLDYGTGGDGAMLAEFVSAIREGRRPQPDGESGLRSLRVVARAYESVRTGAPA